jgi:prepilin-type N-terminal cleavage/methylation domain-containing protein/prepilin-type processing-associated H-X9-DG protein
MGQRRSKGGGGFTLIELMATIAIIATLSPLTIAVVARAKAKIYQTQCLSNLRQHSLAIHSFMGDHSTFPLFLNPGWKFGIEPDHSSTFFGALAKYGLGPIEGNHVYICPSAARQKVPLTPKDDPRPIAGYGYNVWGTGRRLEDEPLGLGGRRLMGQLLIGPVQDSEIANPSEMLLMGDGVRGWNKTCEDGVAVIARSPDAKEYVESNTRVPQRHNKRLPTIFVDGHAQIISLERLFESRADSDLRLWNRDDQPHRERLN